MTSKKGIVACVSDDLTEFEKKQIHPELLKPDLSVHLLPCAIDHKGPAAVSQYFHPTIEDFGDNHLKVNKCTLKSPLNNVKSYMLTVNFHDCRRNSVGGV